MSLRTFLTFSVAALLCRPASALEIAASVYPWDLHDEGVEAVIDNLTTLAGVNRIYLVGLMHPESRPHRSERFPHNPVRAAYMPEDAVATWRPDLRLYGRLKPGAPQEAWLASRDWLAELVAAARARNLGVGFELSHSYLPEAVLFAPGNEDLCQRDLAGKPVRFLWAERFPCPNHPDVAAYHRALVTDIASHYAIDLIQSCQLLFAWGDAATGGCFCASCATKARAEGVDWDAMVADLRKDPQSQPALGVWQAFRRSSAAAHYHRMREAVRAANPRIELRLNHHTRTGGVWGTGALAEVLPEVDSVRLSDYAEQEPGGDRMERKRAWVTEVQGQAQGRPVIAAIGVRPEATPASIEAGVALALERGVQGISLGHYDGATFTALWSVGRAVAAKGAGSAPMIHEIRSLPTTVRRLRSRDHLDDEGVAAINRTPTGFDGWWATLEFPHADGVYDVDCYLVDGVQGAATVTVAADGGAELSARLDRQHGVWERRTMGRMELRRGQQLRLAGRRDGEDWAITSAIGFRRVMP